MKEKNKQIDNLIKDLQERAKELSCLYKIEELLKNTEIRLDELLRGVVNIVPSGMQYPDVSQAEIIYDNHSYRSPNFEAATLFESADIEVQDKIVGQIIVSYKNEVPLSDGGYFLKEEKKLIKTIADRIGHTILHKELKTVFDNWEWMKKDILEKKEGKWKAIVDTVRRSDKKLFVYISRKMLNFLCWHGVEEAKVLLEKFGTIKKIKNVKELDDVNRPIQKQGWEHFLNIGSQIFQIASKTMSENQIVSCIQKWIQEDKSRFLVRAIESYNYPLADVIDAITRYHYIESKDSVFSPSIDKGLRVSLVRRFLSDDLKFINIAKNYIEVHDYYELAQRIIYPSESRGKLGGKSSGLFLATRILQKCPEASKLMEELKVPKTWYITSDGLTSFLHYNNLDEVIEQKYKDSEEIEIEYPNIIQIFKNSYFPPEIIKELSIAMEYFNDSPIIVRSSSLLEDRVGAVFSGKYKSLFLANQGSKEGRLDALMDAIAEVYASTFAPDPIEYRAERGLLDFHEEMGILIQQVVGKKVGNYFIPAFAGVAFSNNEFRWSARINREDGLIRLVPGLGTRAVDRLTDDYPILIAPGKPDLRVNVTPDEVYRYSPKKIDVINLEKNIFETIEIKELLTRFGNDIPNVHRLISVYKDGMMSAPTSSLNLNFDKDNLVVTFDGVISKTPFIDQIKTILTVLYDKIGTPVDIEFAHDGYHLYLLQSRPQSYSKESSPSPIPQNIPHNDIIFSANRYVSNGYVPDISHIVYIPPEAYSRISDIEELTQIGRIVGKINKLLPKRQFILMGPGRWGSRGDIKLGVNVTYADINNTSMLVEIARKKGNYIPELSFGTHFFQDLVESSIRYLPLYPDEDNSVINDDFLSGSKNILSEILPEFASYSEAVRIIDVAKSSNGRILRVLMNADLDKAVGLLSHPRQGS